MVSSSFYVGGMFVISLWDLKNKKSILRYVYMQVCAHRVRRMQVSKRVAL